MVDNTEKEYSNYVCSAWKEIANTSKHSPKPHRDQEQMYDAISAASNQFLHEKLKVLDEEKDSFWND